MILKSNTPELKKVLVIRTDRLGDVILSLPVLTALKKTFPGIQVTMLLRPYTAELVADYADVDQLITINEQEDLHHLKQIRQWAAQLRKEQFDAVLVLHPTFKLALLCVLARIPVRVGTGYRAYSFLFNRKVYHHRKNAERHELDYNLELAEKIGVKPDKVQFKLKIPKEIEKQSREFINKIKAHKQSKVVILHPGSGSSALDWPLNKLAQLNDRLHQELGVTTIVTGSPNEATLVDKFIGMTQYPPVKWIGTRGLKHLAALIQAVDLLVANSTGPLHLAVAVSTPVVGFYCPIIPCLPQRWGPYGQLDSVLMPPVEPCRKCQPPKCKKFNCMELITVDSAFKLIKEKLENPTWRIQNQKVKYLD